MSKSKIKRPADVIGHPRPQIVGFGSPSTALHTRDAWARPLALCLAAISLVSQGAVYRPSSATPPAPTREMRAAWIASVSNIDWPSTNGLSTAEQKAELVALLNNASRLKLNTIILQVRPGCDALYTSEFEPWSEYLTGTMGRAPRPFYDPLSFAVAEAHKRGLELHAWFNPFRARHAAAKSPIAANHISRTHPHWVRQYGKSLWLDPGEKEVQDYTIKVIMDVVKRYDVDGIHIDDYFYPYKELDSAGRELDFPDQASWSKYGAGGRIGRDDWRRENVNVFIRRLYGSVKACKPWVRVGVSPFGIWRPGNPAQIEGFDPYAKLYADSRKWLSSGWVDYFAPQLYWAIDPPQQSFPVLLRWWAAQNTGERHLVAGMDSTKVGRRWAPEEIVNQIRLARKQAGAAGHVHWNMGSLMRNPGLQSALEREVYQERALLPACAWTNCKPLAAPRVEIKLTANKARASWAPGDQQCVSLWLLQTCRAGRWTTQILPATTRAFSLGPGLPETIAVSAVDRSSNLSRSSALRLTRGSE